MLTYLRRLVDERTNLTETMTRTADQAAAEERDLTEAESTALAGLQNRCGEIDRQLTQYNEQAESMRAFADLQSRLETRREESNNGSRTTSMVAAPERTWGQGWVESDAFRTYRGVGQSAPFELAGYLETRAVVTTAQLAIPHQVLPPSELAATRTPLLELVNRVTVGTGVVDWVEIGADPVAAVVAEGAAKPEAAFTMTPKTAALDTIAHWMQITRQALDDAPYMRSLIEGKLRRGLLAKAEADMAAALVAATLPATAGASLLAAIRAGIGIVEAAGYQPNAVVLNPADFAALDVDVMGTTDTGPVRGQSFWGLTPVAVASQPAGTATVGDYTEGATLFDRGVSNVFVTDSHASLFISNILVILAEARLKSAVTDLAAFCECTKTP